MSIKRRVRSDGRPSYQVRVSVEGRRLPAETFDTRREARRREGELVAKRRRASTAETCDSFAERWPDDWPIVKSGPTRGVAPDPRQLPRAARAVRAGVPRRAAWRRRPARGRELRRRAPSCGGGRAVDVRRRTRRRDGREQPVRAAECPEVRWPPVSGAAHGRRAAPARRPLPRRARAGVRPGAEGDDPVTGYVGPRIEEGCALEWPWVDLARSEVTFEVAKFDKPRTVLLLPEAAEALRSMPRRADEHPQVFRAKRGLPFGSRSGHYYSWSTVRAAFWTTLSEQRRREIQDLDWHSLRHFCGWYFYVHLGFTDELTAYQLRACRREARPRPLRPRPRRRA